MELVTRPGRGQSETWSYWMYGLCVLLIAAECLAILRWYPRDQTLSPLHYTIYFGINLTGRWYEMFIPPALGFGAVVSHMIISRLAAHPMWRRLWSLLALFINILVFLDVAAVLYLVHTSFGV